MFPQLSLIMCALIMNTQIRTWHPDRSLYGRIKPMLSEHKWLRGTDWLNVVIDAAHKRKMKVGVEISHTIFSSKQLMLKK